MTELIERYETGYLATVVTRTADAYQWTHTAGVDRPQPLAAPSEAFRRAADRARYADVRFTLPSVLGASGDGIALAYRAPGPRALGAMLIGHEDPDGAADLLAAVARCLSLFHVPAGSASPPRTPHGIERLAAWLDSAHGPKAAAAWHTMLRQHLGDERWERVRQWCEEFANPAAPYVIHGAAGLGVIIPSASGISRASVLAGSEEAASHREFDLGWLLGELHECVTLGGGDAGYLHRLRDAFLASYLPATDERLLGIATALRAVIHTHDFSAYVGWSGELLNYAQIIRELVDTQGAAAFASGTRRH